MNDANDLEGQAYAAALLRAKALAKQTAKQASVKLGEIISITNSTEYTARLGKRGLATPQMMVAVEAAKLPMLELHRAIRGAPGVGDRNVRDSTLGARL